MKNFHTVTFIVSNIVWFTDWLRKFLHESRRRMIPAVMSKFFPLSPENASEQNHEILGVRIFQVLSKMFFL